MTVPYHRPLRNIAYRAGALRGSVPAGVDISFNTLPLTVADFKGGASLEACKDALQMAEEKLANVIADTGNHPFRRYLLSQTAAISNQALIPSTDSNSKLIIGIRGSVIDGADSVVCTEQPLEVVRRMARNANTWRKGAVYYYHIDDNRIFHTRTNVKIDVCTYDAAAQRTAIDANSNMLLPDSLEEALVCGGVAYLTTSDEFSADYGNYFDETVIAIRQGMISARPKTLNPAEVTA